MLTLDARNHGGSPHSPVMTYEAMSLDVQQLLARLGIPKCIVLGHSMGGKTAMALALQRVSGRLRPVAGAGRVAGRCGKGVATTRWGVTPGGAQGRARGALRWGRRRLEAFKEPCREPWPGPATQSGAGRSRLAFSVPRLCPQPDLVERLISVDISPVSTTLVSEFSAYISAMQSVNIPAGLSRSAARQLADSQLSPAVQVGNPSAATGLLLLACPWDTGL